MVNNRNHRLPSVVKDAEFAKISPDAPIVLFMGGPGGGKTRHAARIRDALSDRGLVHICMPDLIRNAINKYKDHHAEWKEAAERYARGELISNNLTQDLVKAEMGKHPFAKVYFLEGFPREARQVEDFERNIRPVNMAMILDYDEDTLRSHMHNRGLSQDVINRRINEFKNKTLPSAKYFDDQRLLHLIPGEKDDNVIFDRMKKLVLRAMESGVPVYNSNPPSGAPTPLMRENSGKSSPAVANSPMNGIASTPPATGNAGIANGPTHSLSSSPITAFSKPNTAQPVENGERDSQTPATGVKSPPSQSPAPSSATGRRSRTPSRGAAGTPQRPPSQKSFAAPQPKPTASTANNSAANSPVPNAPRVGETVAPTPSESKAGTSPVPQSAGSRRQSVTTSNGTPKPRTPSAGSVRSKAATPAKEGEASEAIGSQPATPLGSRPGTNVSRRTPDRPSSQKSNAVPGTSGGSRNGTPAPNENGAPEVRTDRPASSVATTPAPVDGPYKELTVSSDGRPPSTANSQSMSSTDLFPKGLPNDAPIVLIIGAPGSNKSQLAQRIAKKYEGFVHVSMGDLFRRKVMQNQDDELWTRIGRKMDKGEAIPMKIARELLYTTIHEMGNGAWGYVIEGYPRTLAQAEEVENQLGRLDISVLIDCTEQYCRDNIKKRFQEGREDGMDRLDDEESAVKTRLGLFKQNTLPMLKYLDDKGKLRVVSIKEIEGDSNLDKVFDDIINAIDPVVQEAINNKTVTPPQQHSVDEGNK